MITSGPARVLSHGSVTTFLGSGISLRVVEEGTGFELILNFEGDPDLDDVRIDVEHTRLGLRLTCVNFDGSDGRGTSVPIVIGSVGEDLIMAHFRVFLHGNTHDRTVHYTFYRAPKQVIEGA